MCAQYAKKKREMAEEESETVEEAPMARLRPPSKEVAPQLRAQYKKVRAEAVHPPPSATRAAKAAAVVLKQGCSVEETHCKSRGASKRRKDSFAPSQA